jgi:CBS domain-containing protein
MDVSDVMTREVRTCTAEDGLQIAAQLMWALGCGCVPVVDEEDRVVGMLTDRDVCIAALAQHRPLDALRAASAMTTEVYWCKPDDTLAAAAELMRAHRVRRLPVVASNGRLVGILSLSDLAREAVRDYRDDTRVDVTPQGIGQTLAAVCEPCQAAWEETAA